MYRLRYYGKETRLKIYEADSDRGTQRNKIRARQFLEEEKANTNSLGQQFSERVKYIERKKSCS